MLEQQNQRINNPDKIESVTELVVPGKQAPERVDSYVARMIQHATRSRVQRAIELGSVTVNGVATKANYKVKAHDVIRIVVQKFPPMQLIPQDIPLDILHEDSYLLVVNKAAGMPVHPGIGNRAGTLVNAVLWHNGIRDAVDVQGDDELFDDEHNAEDAADVDSDDTHATLHVDATNSLGREYVEPNIFLAEEFTHNRPGIIHRLDKNTSGVMVVGKHHQTTLQLSNQFRNRTVAREYRALVWGVVEDDELLIEGDIGRSPRDRKLFAIVPKNGKYAATEVKVLERYACTTLVACKLRTGRTHQIRVHMASKNHPIVADHEYGGAEAVLPKVHHSFRMAAREILSTIQRQALHAHVLGFEHPVSKEHLFFQTPLPDDIEHAVSVARKHALLLLEP
jgi:23S rRNA pseudouridine1911/1915/1917 synthase